MSPALLKAVQLEFPVSKLNIELLRGGRPRRFLGTGVYRMTNFAEIFKLELDMLLVIRRTLPREFVNIYTAVPAHATGRESPAMRKVRVGVRALRGPPIDCAMRGWPAALQRLAHCAGCTASKADHIANPTFTRAHLRLPLFVSCQALVGFLYNGLLPCLQRIESKYKTILLSFSLNMTNIDFVILKFVIKQTLNGKLHYQLFNNQSISLQEVCTWWKSCYIAFKINNSTELFL